MSRGLNEYLKPAFDSIMSVLPPVRCGERIGLMIADQSKYDGWVDGVEGDVYVAIFDRRYEKGRRMSDLFSKSKAGKICRFEPEPGFPFEGELLLHKEHDQLEWIALRLSSEPANRN